MSIDTHLSMPFLKATEVTLTTYYKIIPLLDWEPVPDNENY